MCFKCFNSHRVPFTNDGPCARQLSFRPSVLMHGKVSIKKFNVPAGDTFQAISLAGGHVISINLSMQSAFTGILSSSRLFSCFQLSRFAKVFSCHCSSRLLYCCSRLLYCCSRLLYCCSRLVYCCSRLVYCCSRLVYCCSRLVYCCSRLLYCCYRLLYCCSRLLYCCSRLLYCCSRLLYCCSRLLYCCSRLLYCCSVLLCQCVIYCIHALNSHASIHVQ